MSGHNAAVKALCWSPHKSNLLVSGGGTTDKTIKFWNTNNFKLIKSIDTGFKLKNKHTTNNYILKDRKFVIWCSVKLKTSWSARTDIVKIKYQ